MAGGESRFVDCGGVELHIRVWGGGESSPARPPVVLWHGLTRNGGDFAPLARGLTTARDDGFLLFAPDSPGRGFSQWLPAAADYAFDALPALAVKMLRALEIEECDWVGTSMGGILGLRLAAVEWRGKIRRLLINDIGPEFPPDAIDRIRQYAAEAPRFATMAELERRAREIYKPFGALSDSEWRAFAVNVARRADDGSLTIHYDPRINAPFVDFARDFNLWSEFDAAPSRMLVLRGESSNLLTAKIEDKMRARRPDCEFALIRGCGHAPYLNTPDQVKITRDFLRA